MRTYLRIIVLISVLSLLLPVWSYLHVVNELASAQSVENFPPFTYLPVSVRTEQLSVAPLPSGGPSARESYTAIEDESNHAMITFGGAYFDVGGWQLYRYNDAWKLDLVSYTWTQITTSGTPPPPVNGHSAVYDPVDHRMLVFGGGIDGGILNDVYELDLDSYAWSLLSTIGEKPSPRWDHCAVYNSQDHTMVIFGGRDLHVAFNDLWVLDLSTLVWQKIESYGPSARMAQSAIYVPGKNVMLVFGGSNYWVEPPPYDHYNDLWRFSFDTQSWIQLFPVTALVPPARDAHFAAYDGGKNRMLIFGGIGNYDVILNDLWQLNLNTLTWQRIFPTLARDKFAGIFDQSTRELVFFGGESHGNLYMFDDGFRIIESAPSPSFKSGDVNGDGEINMADVVHLVNYLLAGGPEPFATK
jgi:N-acetylneuraminic acid mutarotase